MTMFHQPLQQKQPGSVPTQLLTLYDAYCEFQDYCVFLHKAHEGIAVHAGLEQPIVRGIDMSGLCLVSRSLQIKQQLRDILKLAQEGVNPTQP